MEYELYLSKDAPITPCQRQIVEHKLAGITNNIVIAERLQKSPHTIKNQIGNMAKRLGIDNGYGSEKILIKILFSEEGLMNYIIKTPIENNTVNSQFQADQ